MDTYYIKQKLNLKTGFFKTEQYFLTINKTRLKLIPVDIDNNEEIFLKLSKIKSVNISSALPAEIEIRTEDDTFIGIFPKKENVIEIKELMGLLLGDRFF